MSEEPYEGQRAPLYSRSAGNGRPPRGPPATPSAYGGALPTQASRSAHYDGELPQDFDFGFDLNTTSPHFPQRQGPRPTHILPPPGFSPDSSVPLAYRSNSGEYTNYFGFEPSPSYEDLSNNTYPILSGGQRKAAQPSVPLGLGPSASVSSFSPHLVRESLGGLEEGFSSLNFTGQDTWTQPNSFNPTINLRQISVTNLFTKVPEDRASLPPPTEQLAATRPPTLSHNEQKAKALLSILRPPQVALPPENAGEKMKAQEPIENKTTCQENVGIREEPQDTVEDSVNAEEKKKSRKQGPLRSSKNRCTNIFDSFMYNSEKAAVRTRSEKSLKQSRRYSGGNASGGFECFTRADNVCHLSLYYLCE